MRHQTLTCKSSGRDISIGRGVGNKKKSRPASSVSLNVDADANMGTPLRSIRSPLPRCIPSHNEGEVRKEAQNTLNLEPLYLNDVKLPTGPEEGMRPAGLDGLKFPSLEEEGANCRTTSDQGGGDTDRKVMITDDVLHSIFQRLSALEGAACERKEMNEWDNPKTPSCSLMVGLPPEKEDKHYDSGSSMPQFVNGISSTLKQVPSLSASVLSIPSRSSMRSSLTAGCTRTPPVDSSSCNEATEESDGGENEWVRVSNVGKSSNLRQNFCKGMSLSSVSLTLTQEIAKVMLQMRKMRKRTKTLGRGLREEVRRRELLERNTSHVIHHLFKLVRFLEQRVCSSSASHSEGKEIPAGEGEGEQQILMSLLNTDVTATTDLSALPTLHESRCPSRESLFNQCPSTKGAALPLSGIKPEEKGNEFGGNGEVVRGLAAHQYPTGPLPPMPCTSGAKSRTSALLFPDTLDDGKASRNDASQGKEGYQSEPQTGDSYDVCLRSKQEDPTLLGGTQKLPEESFQPLPMLMDGSVAGTYSDFPSLNTTMHSSELNNRGLPRVEPPLMQRNGRRNVVIEVPTSIAEEEITYFHVSHHRPTPVVIAPPAVLETLQDPPGGDRNANRRQGRFKMGASWAPSGRRAPVRVSCPLPSRGSYTGSENGAAGKGTCHRTASISTGLTQTISMESLAPSQAPNVRKRSLATDAMEPFPPSKLKMLTETASFGACNPPFVPSNWDRGPLEGSELVTGIRHDEALTLQSSLDSLDGVTSHALNRLSDPFPPESPSDPSGSMDGVRPEDDSNPTAPGNAKEEERGKKDGFPPAVALSETLPLPQFAPILYRPPVSTLKCDDGNDSFLVSFPEYPIMSPRGLLKLPKDSKLSGATKSKNRSTPSFPSSVRITQLSTPKLGEIKSPNETNESKSILRAFQTISHIHEDTPSTLMSLRK
ncbi:unnamed protein product [Phytomonas sp. EM1]|nr:unnamed protein product [Phytomonas sp. EM1]|eukprot:CCW64009.1 unnamed protein product [Phytomonas sp. isolate EM1]